MLSLISHSKGAHALSDLTHARLLLRSTMCRVARLRRPITPHSRRMLSITRGTSCKGGRSLT